MIKYNYNLNNLKIFQNKYLYKAFINGYAIFSKMSGSNIKIQNTIYYIESHGNKFEFSIEKIFNADGIIEEISVDAKQVENFLIPNIKGDSIKEEFYYIKGKLNEEFRIKNVNEIDELKVKRIFGKNNIKDNKTKCISSDHLYIPLEDNELNVFDTILYKGDKIEGSYNFAKKIMDMENLKVYAKSMRS